MHRDLLISISMNKPVEDPNYDVRFPARRKLIRFLVVTISLAALVFIRVEIENWRGRSAWNKYKRAAEAKGEIFDLRKLAPPEVPDESNFASIPMFAKMFDYTRNSSGKVVWGDTNAIIESPFRIEASYGSAVDSPSSGYWVIGRKTDLSEWQSYYQKVQLENGRRAEPNPDDHFPVPDQPGNPGEDVLLALSKFDPAIAQLREASVRPHSRFPIAYEEHAYALIPHLARLKQASQLLQLRASACLAAGQIESAADDIVLNLRVANSLRDEPLLISHLVRIAMVTVAIYPMWQGLDEQKWDDSQLKAFQEELRKFDFLASQQLTMRGERAFAKMVTDMVMTNRSELAGITVGISSELDLTDWSSIKDYSRDKLRAAPAYLMPDGWIYQNQITIARMFELVLNAVDPEMRRVFKSEIATIEKTEMKLGQGFTPYKMLAAMLFPAVVKSTIKAAFQQTAIDQALLACALERYRLAHGSFPATLAELSPKFIEQIPHDIMNGEPLKYRRTADGKFILYSIGWNEKDDGGLLALSSTGRGHRPEEGDWVWQYSTNSSNAKSPKPR